MEDIYILRNPCKECEYYHKENNTCQSKKCQTGNEGYVTWFDRLFCKPYHNENMERIEDILSRQYCRIEFKDGKVHYFSISTQHGDVDSLEQAIKNIVDADKKFEGMSGLSYVLKRFEESHDIPKYRYGQDDDEAIITEYLDGHLEGGIKQKNLDKILDLIDEYVELKESISE